MSRKDEMYSKFQEDDFFKKTDKRCPECKHTLWANVDKYLNPEYYRCEYCGWEGSHPNEGK